MYIEIATHTDPNYIHSLIGLYNNVKKNFESLVMYCEIQLITVSQD